MRPCYHLRRILERPSIRTWVFHSQVSFKKFKKEYHPTRVVMLAQNKHIRYPQTDCFPWSKQIINFDKGCVSEESELLEVSGLHKFEISVTAISVWPGKINMYWNRWAWLGSKSASLFLNSGLVDKLAINMKNGSCASGTSVRAPS